MSGVQKCFSNRSRYSLELLPDFVFQWQLSVGGQLQGRSPIKIKEGIDFCLYVFREKKISSSKISAWSGHSFTADCKLFDKS